jgi:membrane fusion protein (multidrug efflux system)
MDDVRPHENFSDEDRASSTEAADQRGADATQADARVAAAAADDAPPARGKARAFIALFLVLGALGAWGVTTWLQNRFIQSTDDAFIDGHISQVSPQIGGRVTAILVQDNAMVTAGQELLRIDPRDYQVRLEQAQAQADQAAAELTQARAALAVRVTDLGQAEANIREAQATLQQAQQDLARYTAINPRAITRQTIDSATAAQRTGQARLDASRQAAAGMRAQIQVAQAQIASATAALRTAQANVDNAKLQLSYTRVDAPAPGRITRRTVEVGNYINPGQALLAVVQPGFWVTANFKETQLTHMCPRQPVTIVIDAFPDANLTGHVDSLQTGTGAIFATLPTENATGNYVKVVQRLPVKILFDGDAADHLLLAPGMSVRPRVNVASCGK